MKKLVGIFAILLRGGIVVALAGCGALPAPQNDPGSGPKIAYVTVPTMTAQPATPTPATPVARAASDLEGTAFGINDRSQVVGVYGDIEGTHHAFLWSDEVFTDLGTLGGATSIAHSINNRGQVVGESETTSGDTHAFLWSDGRMIDLGTLGGASSRAVALNEQSQIVGTSETRFGQIHAFLWQGGIMKDVGPLLMTSQAMDINERGDIIGNLHLSDEYLDSLIVRWPAGQQAEVLGLEEDCGGLILASRIADDGAIVGQINGREGFHWKAGQCAPLGMLGGAESVPLDINGRGEVVGYARTIEGQPHAFLWQDGVMADLGTLGGPSSAAWSINELGQIVGGAETADGRHVAFLWQDGVMIQIHFGTMPPS